MNDADRELAEAVSLVADSDMWAAITATMLKAEEVVRTIPAATLGRPELLLIVVLSYTRALASVMSTIATKTKFTDDQRQEVAETMAGLIVTRMLPKKEG